MDKEGVIGSIIFLGVVVLSFVYGFYLVDKGIEIDTTPLYWPETFEPYPEPPEDYYEEYHGKEGKSEYGEYEPNKCLKWGEDAYNKWMESQ